MNSKGEKQACTLVSFDYTKKGTTAYYYVKDTVTNQYGYYLESKVERINYTSQCPWSLNGQSSYYTMGRSIGPTIPVQITSRNQTCQPGISGGSSYGNSCQSLTVSTNWNPYQGLPYIKSLYIYGGMFPYAPCLYDETDTVTWVVMKNPIPMHTAEYERLLALIKPSSVDFGSQIRTEIAGSGFLMNMGDKYQLGKRNGRNVYYNDGGLIQNDDDLEKFYIKCAKAHDAKEQESIAKYIASGARDADSRTEDLAAIGTLYSPIEYQASTLSFYKPPQNHVSTILVCFFMSFLLFAMFAVFYYNRESVNPADNGSKSTSRWYTNMLFAFVCMCVFIMYGLSFVSVSKLGAAVLLWCIIGTILLFSWNTVGW